MLHPRFEERGLNFDAIIKYSLSLSTRWYRSSRIPSRGGANPTTEKRGEDKTMIPCLRYYLCCNNKFPYRQQNEAGEARKTSQQLLISASSSRHRTFFCLPTPSIQFDFHVPQGNLKSIAFAFASSWTQLTDGSSCLLHFSPSKRIFRKFWQADNGSNRLMNIFI